MAVRFDDNFLDEIKSRLRPSDVIGRTVKLRKQGREYVGLSPFNKEKTPSFYVNDDKGQFFDFSSGKTGDLISFLQETERLSFVEAVERLAAEAGLTVPVASVQAGVVERQRQGLSDWLDLASKWFQSELRRPKGESARAYLERRGLPEKEWSRFGVGYAPGGRTDLKDFLVAKGARPADLVDTGLLISPDDGSAPFDRFRDRIIFPIADARGRVVSFGGRALDPKAKAKYLNGPETSVFHKGRNLYGLADARKMLSAAAREQTSQLVVVEGYMDAIACQRAGIAAVAPMGTALTEEQMELLWRYHNEPTLCFDGDTAGQRAADRAVERALPLLRAGRSFSFAFVSGGKDPDDILREHGPKILREQLAQTKPFVSQLYQREHDAQALDTPERRADFKGRLRKAAGSIADKDLAEQYREDLFARFQEQFRRQTFSRSSAGLNYADTFLGVLDKSARQTLRDRIRQFNAAVAVAAVEHPSWVHLHVERLAQRGFGDPLLDPLVQPIMDAVQEDICTAELVSQNIRNEGARALLDRARKIALEAGYFPFLDSDIAANIAEQIWHAAFDAMFEFAAIEDELRERREAKDRREPVLDNRHFYERGRWLRAHELELGAQISNGEVWGHGDPRVPVPPRKRH